MATIRAATKEDLPRILDIFNHAIVNTTASAECEALTLEERTRWFDERSAAGYPVLVYIEGDDVKGWAALGPHSEKEGYRFTAENSVYVCPTAQGQGIGKALLIELCLEAKKMELHSIIAKIDAENPVSIRLHEQLGFHKTGYYPELYFKFGQFWDVVSMVKRIE